jgi:hypothetical protein
MMIRLRTCGVPSGKVVSAIRTFTRMSVNSATSELMRQRAQRAAQQQPRGENILGLFERLIPVQIGYQRHRFAAAAIKLRAPTVVRTW